jgi:hypothetical protein
VDRQRSAQRVAGHPKLHSSSIESGGSVMLIIIVTVEPLYQNPYLYQQRTRGSRGGVGGGASAAALI